MYPASLIAYAFVQLGIKNARYVSQLKVQKMVYFAQGYHLAQFGTPLIRENIEAWQYGPVVPEIYHQYRFYGSKPIRNNDYLFNEQLSNEKQMQKAIDKLDDNAKAAIAYTFEATKDLTAFSMTRWSHKPEGPWSKYYLNTPKGTPIDSADIQSYFQKFLSKNNGIDPDPQGN